MMERIHNGFCYAVIGLSCTVVLMLSVFVNISHSVEPIKIGAVLCVTGWAGGAGTPDKEAIEIVVERINSRGGILGRPVEVYFEDDQSNPTNAAIATTKLIRDRKVCAIVGSSLTNMCMSMIPIFEREQVVNVSLGAGHEITDPIKKWVFRGALTDIRVSPILLKVAAEQLGARKIALLHSTDASGEMGARGVKENVERFGLEIVITEKFDPKDTNMIPQLTKIKASQPDAIILFASAAPAAVVAKNYKQLGMEITVVGSHGIPTKEFVELAPSYIYNGRWIVFANKGNMARSLPPDDPYRRDIYEPFIEKLIERHGKDVRYTGFYGNGHDGITAVIEALKIARTDDRAALRNAMEKVSFSGLLADFRFSPTDHDGIIAEKYGVPMMLVDGQWWPYKK